MIRKVKGGFQVLSEAGKNLGGPYATKELAEKRLAQVEKFKHMNKSVAYVIIKSRTRGAKDIAARKKRGFIKVRNPNPHGEPFIWVKPKKAELVSLNIEPDKKTYTSSSQPWLDRNRDYLD